MYIPTYDDMLAAHDRIRPHIRLTPVRTSDYLNDLTGAQLFFKCENFQDPGAFKVWGATNAVFGLTDSQAKKNIATHSSGNHASCLSYAAMLRGIPCNVVMPRTAPQAKKDTVRRYGGVITECEPSTSSREEIFAKVQAATGGDFVHPYNDPRVIAGQGTCAREFMEQTGGLDMVVAPIGGGKQVQRLQIGFAAALHGCTSSGCRVSSLSNAFKPSSSASGGASTCMPAASPSSPRMK